MDPPASPLPPSTPVIAGTGTGLPHNVYSQTELVDIICELMPKLAVEPKVLRRLFRRVGVGARYFALQAEDYKKLRGFEARCEAWIEVAKTIGEQAIRACLDEAGLEASDISELVTTTVTGIAVPSLDAQLMNCLDFAPTLKRVPLFGLGCVGGAAGIARVADYLRGHPEETAMLLAVELCSLTMQTDDPSIANLISAGLFGDGAAAVLLVGANHPLAKRARPAVLDSCATFFPDTERMMGWDIVDTGFKIVLSPEVPSLVERELPKLIDPFLATNGLARGDVGAWIAHPGGPKVIRAVQAALGLDDEQVEATREGLAELGNLSSASVLFLLHEFCHRRRPEPGTYGVLFALGPAFCAEAVLVRW
jgi:alkylresorcinol/alkylpyrone synthase